MAIAYSYPTAAPELQDLLIGTEMAEQGGEGSPRTRTFTVGSIVGLITSEISGGIPGPVGPTGAQGIQGSPGVQGLQGAAGPVGPAGLNWQGSWIPNNNYNEDDAVGYGGASYFCILEVSDVITPNLDTTHWALLASQGAIGEQGPTGPQGTQGDPGPSGTINEGDYVKNTADVFVPTPKITQIVTLSLAQYTAAIKSNSTLYIII